MSGPARVACKPPSSHRLEPTAMPLPSPLPDDEAPLRCTRRALLASAGAAKDILRRGGLVA